MKDDDEVSYEVGKRDDGKLWTVTITAPSTITEPEFAGAMLALGQDILDGNVSFDTAPDVIHADSH